MISAFSKKVIIISIVMLFLSFNSAQAQNNLKLEIIIQNQNQERIDSSLDITTSKENVINKITTGQFKVENLNSGMHSLKIGVGNNINFIRKINFPSGYYRVTITINKFTNEIKKEVEHYIVKNENLKLEFEETKILALTYLDYDVPSFDFADPLDNSKFERNIRSKGLKFIKENKPLNYKSKINTNKLKLPNKIKKDNFKVNLVDSNKKINIYSETNINEELKDKLLNESIKIINSFKNKNKINIVLTPFDNNRFTGIFNPEDLYSNNKAKVIFINSNHKTNTMLTALVNQYTQLYYYLNKKEFNKTEEDIWFSKGWGFYISNKLGYINFNNHNWSANQGVGWIYDETYGLLNNFDTINLLAYNGSLAYTGNSILFINYLIEQFSPELINYIERNSASTIKSIESYTNLDFNFIYMNYISSIVVNNLSTINNSIYNFENFNLDKMPYFKDLNKINEILLYKKGTHFFKVKEGDSIELPILNSPYKLGISIIEYQN